MDSVNRSDEGSQRLVQGPAANTAPAQNRSKPHSQRLRFLEKCDF